MSDTFYELWIGGEFYCKFENRMDAVTVAHKKKELGYVGTISIYKMTIEKISY